MEEEVLLIEQAVKGDSRSFGVLYDNYHHKVYRFIYLKTGTREDAEDLTHQVFLHAWRNIKGYVHRGHPFSSWLYRIARNAVIDFYRTRKDPLRMEELDPEVIGGPLNLESSTDDLMQLGRLMGCLRELPPKYQDVLILRFVDELSLKETAMALGKSEGAVKLLQYRATKALQKKIEHGS
jgi:RNA polymerase sigma-70 factor (ECF subfamily)